MPTLETSIRFIVIGQQLLIMLLLILGSGRQSVRFSGALLLFGTAGYLYNSDPVIRDSVQALLPLAMLAAISVPYGLWAFSRAVFEAPLPGAPILICAVAVGFFTWLIFVGGGYFTDFWRVNADLLMHVVALFIVGHALWLTAAGRSDDLLEGRRRFRVMFVVLVSLQVTAVLVAELLLGGLPPPAWLTLVNVIAIGALTMGLAVPLLRLNPEFFAGALVSQPVEQNKESFGAAERALYQKLMTAMKAGVYRRPGLTIRNLAGELGFSEHHLRKLVNHRLGFRNFSAFLNSYRIEDAKTRLAQLEYARTPVLTIALDLGYGSLGPFNRAFKATTGMTPTAYREQAISATSADSE